MTQHFRSITLMQAIRHAAVFFIATTFATANDVELNGRTFTIPDGFQLELVTNHNLTKRPIVVDFDDDGNLYVAESSGTNDNVQIQLEQKPHSILRLTDVDDDGIFDKRTVFADRMMFPEGAMWHDGSLYVAAPPQIWKLTDTDDDGVADEREIWFDGKTLTGCANDLHGPYFGPDGWIYWCKGAFAEQTYDQGDQSTWTTRAAHIFRRRPTGGPIEAVMTGGMDNPVEVAFTPAGDRIFTTTFLQHPAGGKRDGLIHAIYGGVYGKSHGVLEGHPRTGDLMPVMTHLGAAAPSGLSRLQSDTLGLRNQLVTACFNLHRVTRHEMVPDGPTFKTRDFDLVATDELDFHPTDVLETPDGNLLIVDTGGWYKLCCPTSQLHKPDVFGGIYRLSRTRAETPPDPLGRRINWKQLTSSQLCDLLDDTRPRVRNKAVAQLASRGPSAIAKMEQVLSTGTAQARHNVVWAACRIDHPQARRIIRKALDGEDTVLQQIALHAVSLWRDSTAVPQLQELLSAESAAIRRLAAESLGRIGDVKSVADLMYALRREDNRVLEHSIIYALIETNAAEATQLELNSPHPIVRRAAALALQGMKDGNISRTQLGSLLGDEDVRVRAIATQIAAEHPEWGDDWVPLFQQQMESGNLNISTFAKQVSTLCNSTPVRHFALALLEAKDGTELKLAMLDTLDARLFDGDRWRQVIGSLLEDSQPDIVAAAIATCEKEVVSDPRLQSTLRQIATGHPDVEVRLQAIRLFDTLDDAGVRFGLSQLDQQHTASRRSLAASVFLERKLTTGQLAMLANSISHVGPLELPSLLNCFEEQSDRKLGGDLVTALLANPAAAAVPTKPLAKLASQFGTEIEQLAKPLFASRANSPAQQRNYLRRIVESLPNGDVRRGQRVFHSAKAACFNCHAIGYRGGAVGPDLSRIARVRSREDLLEAIVYPSASFVRSYEPVMVLTSDGKSFSGAPVTQTSDSLTLQLNATDQKTIRLDEIVETTAATVSIMPAGLDQQLSSQEFADLLEFLMSRK